jgi:hypothetical protein
VPLKRILKLIASVVFLGGMDFWLWPELFTEKISFFNNQTGEIQSRQPDFDKVRLYFDDFFDQWHTSHCFDAQTCDFHMFVVTYFCYMVGTMAGCGVLSSSAMPRFGIVLSGTTGSLFNVYHSYIVRGRFLPPDSLVMWGAQFGSLAGPSLYACMAYLLETPNHAPIVVASQP